MQNDKNGTSKERMQRKVQIRVFSLKESKKPYSSSSENVLSMTAHAFFTRGNIEILHQKPKSLDHHMAVADTVIIITSGEPDPQCEV